MAASLKISFTYNNSCPSMTRLTNEMANNGSIPLEQSAIIEMVPVGAMVMRAQFLNVGPLGTSYTLPLMWGNVPFSLPSSCDIASASSRMNLAIFSANAQPSSEL